MHNVTAAPSANVEPENYRQAVPVHSNAARTSKCPRSRWATFMGCPMIQSRPIGSLKM